MGSSKKSKKRKRSIAVEPDDETTFAVELILRARVPENALSKSKDEHWDYYVKWAGYDSDANSWEPAKNLSECERLVSSFWSDVGWDNSDYAEGAEVVPSDKWIEAERKRFWQSLTPEERKGYSAKEEERRAQTQHRKAFEAAYAPHLISSPEPEPQKRGKIKKMKSKKPRVVKEEPDADSDMALIKQDKSKPSTIPAKRRETPWSSDDEPLKQRTGRKIKKVKLSVPAESTIGSSNPSPQPEPSKRRTPLPATQQTKADKGKRKAAEEPRPDSPSSLFSVDSSEEVAVPSTKPKPEVRLAPDRKLSTSLNLITTSKGASFKSSPTVTHKTPSHTYLKHSEPTLAAPSAGGIPTKQRLGAKALTLAPATKIPVSTTSNPIPSSGFGALKFKKNSTSTVIVPNESTVESPTIRPPELTLNALNVPATRDQSPSHMLAGSFLTESPIAMEPPRDRFPISPQVPSMSNASEAEEFLSSMLPSLPGLAGPLEPTIEPTTSEPKPPPSFTSARKPNIPKIPKKWKWEGKLFILKPDDKEELVGSVVCTNVTTPKPRGMRIHLTFDVMDRLNFISFHDLSDTLDFLEACKTPDQFATLSAQDSESQSQFTLITSYMAKHEQVVLAPVWYEKNLVGHLVFFHPTSRTLVQHCGVPSDIIGQAAEGLIVSLHGWILNPTIQQQESRLSLSDLVPAKSSLAPPFAKGRFQDGKAGPTFDYGPSLRKQKTLHLGLRALTFPPDLFDWLTASFRLYAIYHEHERGEDKSEPFELRMLKTVLRGCQAQEWKHHESKKELRLRIVFVHVGSVRNFSRSPLTQKRNRLDIRFYSYGTDGYMPRSMWGVKEIYPIGGVVTFYPSAITDNYIETIRLIQKINEHPLWMAFISPTCLGYLAALAYKGEDPLVAYEHQGQAFALQRLLNLIADGEIALISVPPDSSSIESMKSWVRSNCRTFNTLDALSIGTAAFNSVCANVLEADWVETVQKNADRDIVTIQRHPAILYEYRRFIVVQGGRDHAVPPTSVEATLPLEFDFQDDYFKRRSS